MSVTQENCDVFVSYDTPTKNQSPLDSFVPPNFLKTNTDDSGKDSSLCLS